MKLKSILFILLLTVGSFSFTKIAEEEKEVNTEINLVNEAYLVKDCCSFSGSFKYNSKGWEFGGKFTINFGLAGPPPNGGGNSNTGWGEIILGGNATHGNYIVITPPKEYIGKTIEISDSNIQIRDASCGSELLQFINLKAQRGKIVLKEKTMIKIVNLPKHNERVFDKAPLNKKAVKMQKN